MGNYLMNVYQKNILKTTRIEVAARLKDLQACREISGLVKIYKFKSSNASMKKKLVITRKLYSRSNCYFMFQKNQRTAININNKIIKTSI